MTKPKHKTCTVTQSVIFENVIFLALLFTISNVDLVNEFKPFLYSLLFFSFFQNKTSPILCIIACLISVSLTNSYEFLKISIELISIFLLCAIAKRFISFNIITCIFIKTITAVIIIVAFKLYSFDIIISRFIESFISIIFMCLLNYTYNFFNNLHYNMIIKKENIVSIFILSAIVLSPCKNINFNNIYPYNALLILLSMSACYIFPNSLSILISLFISLTYCFLFDFDSNIIMLFCLASSQSLIIPKYKRLGILSSFLILSIVIGYIGQGNNLYVAKLLEVLLASFIFSSIPEKIFSSIQSKIRLKKNSTDKSELHLNRFRSMTSNRLNEIAQVFLNTGNLFISTAKQNINFKGNISKVLNNITKEVCFDCKNACHCWEDRFLESYNCINSMFMSYEKQGVIVLDEKSESFLSSCIKPQKLYDCANIAFYNYLINLRWKKKVEESKACAGEQLCGVSKVIRDISSKISSGFMFMGDLEEEIFEQLCKKGYRPHEVCVEDSFGSIVVSVKMASCKGEEKCKGNIEKLISKCCGKRMMISDERCTGYGKKYCTTRYQQLKRFSIYTGLATISKKGVCGDSHSFYGLENGKYMMLICDGMGSGNKARRESEATALLLENFFHAQFDEQTILNTINKLLILKSPDEMFSTVDMCVVDLIKGSLKFTKIGAPHSFIIRGSNVTRITSSALPLGILDAFVPMTDSKNIADGDLIIMFSDGVADIHPNDDWILDAVGNNKNPQVVADRILQATLNVKQQQDDITIVVGRIVEKNKNYKALCG